VHDEVVVDTLRSELDRVKQIVQQSMESVASLRVPLISDAGIGENWLEAH
jgi:DNA polymerase-1